MPDAFAALTSAAATLDDLPFGERELHDIERAGLTAAVDRIGLLVITPDAIHRQLERAILTEVAASGLAILAYRVKYLDDREIEELYKHGLRRKILDHRRTHWHLTRKGFGLGASLGLLVGGAEPGVTAKLVAMKGASEPRQNGPATLRGRYGSYSKILSLVHSSDDPVAAFRESHIYFSHPRMLEALGLLADPGALADAAVPPDRVVRAVSSTTATAHPFEIFYSVKCRLIDVLLNVGAWDAGAATVMRRLGGHYAEMHATVGAHPGPWCELYDPVEDALGRERTDVQSLLEQVGGTLLEQGVRELQIAPLLLSSAVLCLQQLADVQGFAGIDFEQLRQALVAVDVHMTSWETLVLENLLHFW